jgi:hypothetical protein
MAGAQKQREEPREKVSHLPHVERVEEIHPPIESLGRSATYLLVPPDATYISLVKANTAIEIARNVSDLHLNEAVSLSSRFARLLEVV